MLTIYFSFILTIAFKPKHLGQTLGEGTIITLGIPIGILIIMTAIVLTGVYVRKANKEFDQIIQKIIEEVEQ